MSQERTDSQSLIGKETVENGTIIQIIAGSRLYGIHNPDSDTDILGVCIEPEEFVIGLNKFEQWDPKELNGTIYSLRKFVRLVLNGNPTVSELLFAPPQMVTKINQFGHELQQISRLIVSKQTLKCYSGYLRAQKERLLGQRGQLRVNRPGLINAYGYDTKFAAHALRLGILGCEMGAWGDIILPMQSCRRALLSDVRNGKFELQFVIGEIERHEKLLELWIKDSKLPEKPDFHFVNNWMIDVYKNFWENDQC